MPMDADAAAAQILRAQYVRVPVNHDAAMIEAPMRKDRDGGDRHATAL